MTHLASISRSVWYSACVLALASACGGQSFNGNGGEAGNGATGHGGTTSTAGKTSTGGKAHGGTSSTGGVASAGTASGGSAGMHNEACDGPPEVGDIACDAAIQRWSHDAATGICRPISYGGCGATKNNYETLAACQQACPGGNPNIDACKVPTDCIVTSAGCCGVCDGPGLSAHDLIAYNKQYGIGIACGNGPVPGGAAGDAAPGVSAPIACPACAAPAAGTGSLKYFVPNCVQGQCVVEDIRDSAFSACKIDAECELRNGTSCCESCTSDNLVAVRTPMRGADAYFGIENLVCGDVQPPCPACVPSKPSNAFARCGPTGHCMVDYLPNAR